MKSILTVIAVALVVIATNMTLTTTRQFALDDNKSHTSTEETVQVIGRYQDVFDGFGGNKGFLVKSSRGFERIRVDTGSMADNPEWKPEYLAVYRDKGAELRIIGASVVVYDKR